MGHGRISQEFEHEKLTLFRDSETGAVGAIAVHSTTLGPSMGGVRLVPYASLEDAIVDALRLSRAMSFKSAAAGLDLGGGKAVLIDDGLWQEGRRERMRAFGKAVDSLGGRYITAEDVGTATEDMDAVADVTAHVAGKSGDRGGKGDPSPATARTVFEAIRSAVRLKLDGADLQGVRVGVLGVGHVGTHLVGLLAAAGAEVLVSDVDPARVAAVVARGEAKALPLAEFVLGDFDVLSPCALGGAIRPEHLGRLRSPIIAGGANNVLAERALAAQLLAEDVMYVPDFICNCGGIIWVGAEVLDLGPAAVEDLIVAAIERTDALLVAALERSLPPLELAENYAAERLRGSPEPVL